MTVPGYTDISHFRAPYKNAWPYTGISGFGQEPGMPPPPGPPPTTGPPSTPLPPAAEAELAKYIDATAAGGPRYNSETQKILMEAMKGYRAIWLTDRAVKIVPYSQEEIAAMQSDSNAKATLEMFGASKWIEDKLSENMVVFATLGVLVPGLTEKHLAAVPAEEKETVVMTAHIAPILAEPGFLSRAGMLTTAAVAVSAIVGGVLLWSVLGRRRRKA